jgi:hypothetical protein
MRGFNQRSFTPENEVPDILGVKFQPVSASLLKRKNGVLVFNIYTSALYYHIPRLPAAG